MTPIIQQVTNQWSEPKCQCDFLGKIISIECSHFSGFAEESLAYKSSAGGDDGHLTSLLKYAADKF